MSTSSKAIPTLLGITLVVFCVMHLIPGDPADVLLGQDYSENVARQLRSEWGLDQPIILQYAKWLVHILQGDWGMSFFSRQPVFTEVMEKLLVSLQVIAFAMCFALLIGQEDPCAPLTRRMKARWNDAKSLTNCATPLSKRPSW